MLQTRIKSLLFLLRYEYANHIGPKKFTDDAFFLWAMIAGTWESEKPGFP